MDWVKSIFLESNVDPGILRTWQNHGDQRNIIFCNL